MGRQQYDDVRTAIVIQAVGGDLRVKGREGARLIADGDGIDVEQISDNQPFVIRSGGDCRLVVPDTVDVVVQEVGGDAKLTDLGGHTEIKTIGGDLTLRGVKHVQVKRIGGDLRLKWADGNVTVEQIGSDATIRGVDGSLWIAQVGSDLYIRNVEGSCVAEQVGSDLVLNIDFVPGQDYRFSAGSDILCRIEPDTDARFIVPHSVDVHLDTEGTITESEDGEHQIITLGDGSSTVVIERANELRLVGEEEEYMLNLGVQIEEELEARMAVMEEKLGQQLEGLDERIQAHSEQWISQAERLAERAQRQAERTLENVRRSMGQSAKSPRKRESRRVTMRWGEMPLPPAPPAPPSEPVSEQERLLILKMVQEKRITIEEAERLLAALE